MDSSKTGIVFLWARKPIIAIPIADHSLLRKSQKVRIGTEELPVHRFVQFLEVRLDNTKNLDNVFSKQFNDNGGTQNLLELMTRPIYSCRRKPSLCLVRIQFSSRFCRSLSCPRLISSVLWWRRSGIKTASPFTLTAKEVHRCGFSGNAESAINASECKVVGNAALSSSLSCGLSTMARLSTPG